MTAEPKREAYRVVADLISRHLTHPTEHADVIEELARIERAMRAAAAVVTPERPEAT